MRTIAEVHPQFIKLDMGLVRDIDKDTLKQGIARHLLAMCASVNMRLIAEGVETMSELGALLELGVEYVQGYLLGRPSADLSQRIPRAAIEYMQLIARERENLSCRPEAISIGCLATPSEAISEGVAAKEALALMSEKNLPGIVVTQDERPVGLMMRSAYEAMTATTYGKAIYADKNVRFLMDRNPLVVDFTSHLGDVVQLALARHEEKIYDYVVVVHEERYFGVVTVKKMLEKMRQELFGPRSLRPNSELRLAGGGD